MGAGHRRQRLVRREPGRGPAVGGRHARSGGWTPPPHVVQPVPRNWRQGGQGRPAGLLRCRRPRPAGLARGPGRRSTRPRWWPGLDSGRSTGARLASHPAAMRRSASSRRAWAPTWPSAGTPSRRWGDSPRSCPSARTSTCAGACSSRGTGSSSNRALVVSSEKHRGSGRSSGRPRLRPLRPGPLPPLPAAGPTAPDGAAKSWLWLLLLAPRL